MYFDNNSDSLFSEDEEDFCPLCCEEMDITDKNFKPCPCGYQICQFCYNNIRTNPELNGKCPACRRLYEDKNIEYRNITAEEWKLQKAKIEKRKKEKKIIEKEKKDAEQAKRHHLAGMRVIQKNLVYVVGLNPPCSYDDLIPVLRSDKYFGQYGKINKIVINKRTPNANNYHHLTSTPGYGVYVTFARKEDATKCINAVDGSISDGKLLRAAHGTTKYCSSYLRGQPCPNPNCMFLHEPGEEADSYSRQDLTSRSTNANGTNTNSNHNNNHSDNKFQDNRPTSTTLDDVLYSPLNSPRVPIAHLNSSNSASNLNLSSSTSNLLLNSNDEGPALPATVSWAKNKTQPTFNPLSDPIANTLSAFPSLTELQQSKSAADSQVLTPQQQQEQHQIRQQQQQEQQQLQQLLQKSQQLQKQQLEQKQQEQEQHKLHELQLQAKKKEKKDKEQQTSVVIDPSAISFKYACDLIRNFNNITEVAYTIDSKFKTDSSFKFFHNFDLNKFSNDDINFGYSSTIENKDRMTLLTDSLLFSPFTRNYSYRTFIQNAQNAQPYQNLEETKLNMTPAMLEAQLKQQQFQQQLQHQQQQLQIQLQQQQQQQQIQNPNLESPQAFFQHRLLQQQLNQQLQNSLDNSALSTPVQQPPPGLFTNTNNVEFKSNSQELLSQLMGKKVTA